jgi:hypothetical protein
MLISLVVKKILNKKIIHNSPKIIYYNEEHNRNTSKIPQKTWKETKSIPFTHKYMTFLALNRHLN